MERISNIKDKRTPIKGNFTDSHPALYERHWESKYMCEW